MRTSTNSATPAGESAVGMCSLIHARSARSSRVMRSPRPRLAVHTDAPTLGTSLARAMASSSLSTATTERTGPGTASRTTCMSGVAPRSTVGA